MTAVVLTVKQSYIASTKYKGVDSRPLVQWRMRAPGKKPLIAFPNGSPDCQEDSGRRSTLQAASSSFLTAADPMQLLDQFDHSSSPH
ncbi:unnamed protein product [Protopolystoma xenopodis]|uniref:Uncharacterized protein n=1 Tax=Protopolystoma xenopodis TaxID=117903 RepID=A0A3S5FCP1_9PLAT|nr:unnamed protein product [Protopolystoma xenopodis]